MWTAEFEDGTIMEQFVGESTEERSFGDVLKNGKKVVKLYIDKGSKLFIVDLSDGQFTIKIGDIVQNFYATNFDTTFNKNLQNIRPICFVRETVQLAVGTGMRRGKGTVPEEQFTALGFQANVNGENIKKYLAILPDGRYTIES